ncbi:methyltransferase domain-containing protein [Ornithinimicrobium sp. F0845]|uniref:class I SAM-dependent methyltransferase n=1 Tax=Ornithinimicrobium sp. F0845 TaxID=2926412 RepID=UPI001FF20A3E|nr:methyltransferase domain-containing protein [Ornithinimicrobium sp. F0845]MCK0112621.1 methyltransferase domain-containing protein [Ornithinimicrobium sp. F0845]
MTTATLDLEKVGAFAQHIGGLLAGGATTAMMVVGDRTGLYAAMAAGGPLTPAQLAADTGTAERYVREWLAQQAAVGIVQHDPEDGTFTLPPEHAAVLAADDSPAAMAGAAPLISGMHRRTDELVEAFRSGAGIPWADQDPTVFESTERFFSVGYRNSLVSEWIPALAGVHEKLRAGARVIDVGCGHGAPVLLMAQAYPASQFVGYDVHAASIETATRRAADAGLSDRVRFGVSDSQAYPDKDVDLVTFFDAFHDLGDPVGAAAHARQSLAADGTLVLIEPRAADDLATTLGTIPMAALGFAASTFLCTPNSLSQPVGLALGALAGESRLREVLAEAGFGSVRRAAENDFNMVIEARP